MSRVLQGHEERLQRIESLEQHLKQHQEYSQQYFVHKEVHAASVQGVEQMCTSATQNIESVRGQVTQLHAQFANNKSISNNIWRVKMFWRHELRERNNIVKQVFPCLLRKFHNMWRIIFNHMHL